MSSDEEEVSYHDDEQNEEEDDGSNASSHSPTNIQSRIVITNEGLLDQSVLPKTEGYMYKKGGAVNARGGFRNWKKRWFVIETVDFMDSVSFELQYFDRPGGTMKGKVSLHDVEVFIDEDVTKGKHTNKAVKYEFHLLLQNGSILQLSCDNEDERSDWMTSMEIIIMYLHKKHTSQAMNLNGYDPLADDNAENYQLGHDLAMNCVAYGPGLFGAEAGKRTYFYIQLNDLFGQPVSIGNLPITATVSNATHLYYLDLKDHQDGKFSGSYTLSQAGEYELNILLNEEHHISQSPFHLAILPAKTLAKHCFAEGALLSKLPVPTSPTTPAFTGSFIIQAMDGYGNTKQHGGDPFEIGVLGPAQLVDLCDHEDGKYTVTLQTLPPAASGPGGLGLGGVSIMVSLYGKPIASSPFVPTLVSYSNPNPNPNNLIPSPSVQTTGSPAPNPNPSAAEDASISTRGSRRPPPRAPRDPASPLPAPVQGGNDLTITNNTNTNSNNNGNSSGSKAVAGKQSLPAGNNVNTNANANSVLEESRQRALQAKQPQSQPVNSNPAQIQQPAAGTVGRYTSTLHHPHSQSAPNSPNMNTTNTPNTGKNKPLAVPIYPASTNLTNATTAAPNSTNANGNRLSKLSQLAQRSAATLQTMKQQHSQGNNNPSPAPVTSSSHYPVPSPGPLDGQHQYQRKAQHQEDTYRHVVQGLYPFNLPQPHTTNSQDPHLTYVQQLSPPDYLLYEQLHTVCVSGTQTGALQGTLACHPVITRLLYDEYDVLYSVFCFFADKRHGQLGLPFLPAAGGQQSGGLVRLFELYDLVPYFVSKQQVKVLFTMLLLTQRHRHAANQQSQSQPQSPPPSNALDYASFLQAVLGIALLIFASPTEQQSLSLEVRILSLRHYLYVY